MAETNVSVIWTDRSLSNSQTIKNYRQYYFSNKEIDNYYRLLESFEKMVSIFPKLYPQTNKNRGIRRAVLSKQLSVFYRITKETILVIGILDNRMSDSKWP